MTTTTTPTATVPTATDTADLPDATQTASATATADITATANAADVTALLARLAQVTDQLAAAIHAHTSGDTSGDGDGDGDGGGRVGMPTAGAILAATDRLTATVVAVLASLSHRGVIADEGISAAAWLRSFAARTVADERMLAATVDRLADMPTISRWFSAGQLSWPVVRGIVGAVRNLTREQRRWVDDTLTADPDRARRLDADDLVGAVAALADRARPDLHRDRERRAVQRDRVYCQDGFDGSSYGSWELGPESAEQFRRALFDTNPNHHTTTDTSAGRHHGHDGHDADGDTGHDAETDIGTHGHSGTDTGDTNDDAGHRHADTSGDHHDSAPDGHSSDCGDGDRHLGGRDSDGDVVGDAVDEDDGEFTEHDRWRHRREWSNAQALLALCRQRLGEPGGSAPTPARPSMLVVVDIDALTSDDTDGVGSATAQLLTRSTRGPVELTPAAARRLACDATLRYVLVDGAIPLGVTAAHPKVSATVRAALVVRDGGCRFPACHQPVDVCDNHHVVPVAEGGPTTLDNLALLCLAHHHAVHDSGWASRLHPDGTMTFTRRGVTLTSLPRAEQRFAPTTPPPTGRPARPRPTTSSSGGRTTGDPPRPADHRTVEVDPDPPPEVDLPF